MQTHGVVDLTDRLCEQEEHLPACPRCGRTNLYVLEERPDPNYGALGVVQRTLQCADCSKLIVT
jgi:hypothetical protein